MQKRICKSGHIYYKSSDCPTCSECEQMKKPLNSFMQHLSAPARRAFENAGIISLVLLSQHTIKDILKLHGIGKASIPILTNLLKEEKLDFKKQKTQSKN